MAFSSMKQILFTSIVLVVVGYYNLYKVPLIIDLWLNAKPYCIFPASNPCTPSASPHLWLIIHILTGITTLLHILMIRIAEVYPFDDGLFEWSFQCSHIVFGSIVAVNCINFNGFNTLLACTINIGVIILLTIFKEKRKDIYALLLLAPTLVEIFSTL